MHWEKSEIDKCNSAFIAPTILNLLAQYREWKLFSQVISALLKIVRYRSLDTWIYLPRYIYVDIST